MRLFPMVDNHRTNDWMLKSIIISIWTLQTCDTRALFRRRVHQGRLCKQQLIISKPFLVNAVFWIFWIDYISLKIPLFCFDHTLTDYKPLLLISLIQKSRPIFTQVEHLGFNLFGKIVGGPLVMDPLRSFSENSITTIS